jgi:hypothetical protein
MNIYNGRIVVSPNREPQSTKHFGQIYFVFGNRCFPRKAWTDSFSPLLHWWTGHLNALMERKTSKAELHFMEGPYVLVVSHVNQPGKPVLRCVLRTPNASTECCTRAAPLFASIYRAVTIVFPGSDLQHEARLLQHSLVPPRSM